MSGETPESSRKFQAIAAHLDAAADQILEAAESKDPVKVRAVVMYWFSLIYDEGAARVAQLVQQVELLQKLDAKIKSSARWKRPAALSTDPPPPTNDPKKPTK